MTDHDAANNAFAAAHVDDEPAFAPPPPNGKHDGFVPITNPDADRFKIELREPDRFGKRLVRLLDNGAELYRDSFDPNSEWARTNFAEASWQFIHEAEDPPDITKDFVKHLVLEAVSAEAPNGLPAKPGPRADGYGELLDLAPPNDRLAELSVCGAALFAPELLDDAEIFDTHFYDDRIRGVFTELRRMSQQGEPVDVEHLVQRLKAADSYDGPLLTEIVESYKAAPSLSRVYVDRIKDRERRRRILQAGLLIIKGVHDQRQSTPDLATDAVAQFEVLAKDEIGEQRPKPITAGELVKANPHLHEPIIEGLLRRGETANVIASPKMGKSWLAYFIGLSINTGSTLFGRFVCRRGRVLLIDNELHGPTLAHRLQTVAESLGLFLADYRDSLEILSLRGRLLDLNGIAATLAKIEPGKFDLVILDAFYRSIPAGASENDNATVAGLYNLIDAATRRLDCAWINIHHSSKGGQAEKTVTDVGAGAGAQSRAADAHLILRPHEEPGAVVLEAVVRSFAPVEPVGLRWQFPLWQVDDSLDVGLLRGRLSKGEERQVDRDKEGRDKILSALLPGPQSIRHLRGKLGAGNERCNRLLDALEASGAIDWEMVQGQGGKHRVYRLKETGP